jgi:transposase
MKNLKMTFKRGTDRNQLLLDPPHFGDYIPDGNPVRNIDTFVDSLDLQEVGFQVKHKQEIHSSAFHPAILVKLILYGYCNRIQSSRQLALECTRNIEVMWMLKNLHPSYRTIAYFKSKNRGLLRKLYRQFNKEYKKKS